MSIEKDLDNFEEKIAWTDIVVDMMKDHTKSNKRLGIVCWIMAAVIVIMAVFGLYFYDRMQDKYLLQIETLSARNEKLQADFLTFLSDYDFVTYDDYVQQDGAGYNYYNKDISGDVNNGSDNTKPEANPNP